MSCYGASLVIIIIMTKMAVFCYAAGYRIEERRRWHENVLLLHEENVLNKFIICKERKLLISSLGNARPHKHVAF